MLERSFFNLWYRLPWLKWLLWPLHLPLSILVRLRRLYYLYFSPPSSVNLPVIVVGNINVGGSGKTPFTTTLVELLFEKTPIRPAILSRGYGSKGNNFPHLIQNNDSAAEVGDEPWMMANRLSVPVVVDPDRSRGAQWMANHLDIDIILCDDGLQHYRLTRDYEILVFDSIRRFGNGLVLPFGPLREPVSRANETDLQVEMVSPGKEPKNTEYYCQLEANELRRVSDNQSVDFSALGTNKVVAVCAIADPEKFYQTLSQQFTIDRKVCFADHHPFSGTDFAEFGDRPVIMTEKDAVKCQSFAKRNWYYLSLKGRFSTSLEDKLLNDIQQITADKCHE